MNLIFAKLLKVVGWQWVLKKTWPIAYKALKEQADKTETELDNDALEILNDLVEIAVSDKAA